MKMAQKNETGCAYPFSYNPHKPDFLKAMTLFSTTLEGLSALTVDAGN